MSDKLEPPAVVQDETTTSTEDKGDPTADQPVLDLTCGICKDRYTDPRLLPCLHSFCSKCIKSLAAHVLQGGGASRVRATEAVILCPTCNTESPQPDNTRNGSEYPVDFLLQRALAYSALDPHAAESLSCELCSAEDGAEAVSRCVECMVNICAFCSQAHRRQRRTADHVVLSFSEARRQSAARLPCPVYCPRHRREELRFYCETCDHSVCRDCCLVEHREHLVEYADEVGGHHQKVLSSLLDRLKPHIDAVESGIAASERMEASIAERVATIEVDIEQHFEDYTKALQGHKRRLLGDLARIGVARTKAVQSQTLQYRQVLGDLRHTYEVATSALRDGNSTEILSVKPTLSQRLCDVLRLSYQSPPSIQQASIQFKPRVLSSESPSDNPFNIPGVIGSSLVSAEKSFAKGEGLYRAKSGEETIVIVSAMDSRGSLLLEGGDDIQAELWSTENSKRYPCSVHDNGNGSYKLVYCLKDLGGYTFNIKLAGQHIKGSPFNLTVRTPWKSHTGVWHCCTFCSSEGNKEATCACGGVMPGGFRGCGHNHAGHPGYPHWSCCASLEKDSACTGSEGPPIARSASHENVAAGDRVRLQRRATLGHADRARIPLQQQLGQRQARSERITTRMRDPSPRRYRDPSPLRYRDPSPVRYSRDPSPERYEEPMRLRNPGPPRLRDPSPMRGERMVYPRSMSGPPSLVMDNRPWKNVSF